MFSRNAVGEYLPPMVVYKAKNVYKGTIYDSTPSGWFDMKTFDPSCQFLAIYDPSWAKNWPLTSLKFSISSYNCDKFPLRWFYNHCFLF